MKLSKDTISILKNFKNINKSLVIRQGNKIITKPTQLSEIALVATATLKDTFPQDIGIFDLSHFINIVETMGDSEMEITPDSSRIIFTNNNNKLSYNLSVIDLLPTCKPLKAKDELYGIELSENDITTIRKMIIAISANHVVFKGNDGKLTIELTNLEIPNGEKFVMEVGDSDKVFEMVIDSLYFNNFITGDYRISLHDKAISFYNKKYDVKYLAALKTKFSKIGDLNG